VSPTVRRLRADEHALLRDLRLRALSDAPMAFGSILPREETYGPEQWERWAAVSATGEQQAIFIAEPACGMASGVIDDEDPASGVIDDEDPALAALADGLGRLALLGLLGPGPEAREARETVGPCAIHRGARDLEGDAFDHRGTEDLGPGRLLRGGLGRLFLVEDPPDRLEDLLREQAGEDAEDDSEGLVEELHQREAIRPGGMEFPPTCR
jgi:hypothetical protein